MTAIVRRADTQTSQILLQHYLIAAVVVVLALVALRIAFLRRRNQGISNFFRVGGSGSIPYPYCSQPPPNDATYGSSYQPAYGVQLAPVPMAYRPERRVRAADTDAQGRRLDPAGGDWDGKDALPAYDKLGKPPNYTEANLSHGGEHQAMEHPADASYREGQQNGVRN